MIKQLPSEEMALNFLRQAGCTTKLEEHCRAVADFAEEIAKACEKKGLRVNVELVRIGALLHDVGRTKTHNVDHAIVGAQIAQEWNLPDEVVSIIERHVGGGITEGEARKLGWPVKSYIPESIEERIVAYADKLIESSMRVPVEVAIEQFRRDKNIREDSVERLKRWHEEFMICLK